MKLASHAEPISLATYKWRGNYFHTEKTEKEIEYCLRIHSTNKSKNLVFYDLPVLRDWCSSELESLLLYDKMTFFLHLPQCSD